MYENDSKYLILDIRKKTGHLKYKNRVLKDFRFQTSKNFPGHSLRPGMLTLTEKWKGRRTGTRWYSATRLSSNGSAPPVPPQEAGIPFIKLTRKELLSIYHAVEAGALARRSVR